MNLEGIFDPSMVEQDVAETTDEVVEESVEEVAEEVESEVVEEPKEETKEETTPSEEEYEKENWTLAAVKDERRKRQELEKKLADIEAKQQEAEHPDVFDDQKAFVESMRNEYTHALSTAKLDLARTMMMEFHEDYESMEAKFIEIAQENPTLRDQAMKSSNPAKFAYEQAKKYEQFKEVQNVDQYKEKLRAELRAELEAELKGSQESKATKAQNLTPSLATARSSDKDSGSFQEATLDTLFGS